MIISFSNVYSPISSIFLYRKLYDVASDTNNLDEKIPDLQGAKCSAENMGDKARWTEVDDKVHQIWFATGCVESYLPLWSKFGFF